MVGMWFLASARQDRSSRSHRFFSSSSSIKVEWIISQHVSQCPNYHTMALLTTHDQCDQLQPGMTNVTRCYQHRNDIIDIMVRSHKAISEALRDISCNIIWLIQQSMTNNTFYDQVWPGVTSCDQMWPVVTRCDLDITYMTSHRQYYRPSVTSFNKLWPVVTRCDLYDQI